VIAIHGDTSALRYSLGKALEILVAAFYGIHMSPDGTISAGLRKNMGLRASIASGIRLR
jgi:hypothetical protein